MSWHVCVPSLFHVPHHQKQMTLHNVRITDWNFSYGTTCKAMPCKITERTCRMQNMVRIKPTHGTLSPIDRIHGLGTISVNELMSSCWPSSQNDMVWWFKVSGAKGAIFLQTSIARVLLYWTPRLPYGFLDSSYPCISRKENTFLFGLGD